MSNLDYLLNLVLCIHDEHLLSSGVKLVSVAFLNLTVSYFRQQHCAVSFGPCEVVFAFPHRSASNVWLLSWGFLPHITILDIRSKSKEKHSDAFWLHSFTFYQVKYKHFIMHSQLWIESAGWAEAMKKPLNEEEEAAFQNASTFHYHWGRANLAR